MAKLLTEQELQEIREYIDAEWLQRLFNHIEALEAECAAQRQLIEEIQWTGGGIIFSDDGPVHKTCPKCLLTNTFREHDTDCPISQALSGTAGQALLDELGRLQAVAEAALRVWLLLEALRIEGDIGKVLHQDERGFWQVRALTLESALRAAGYLKEEVDDDLPALSG